MKRLLFCLTALFISASANAAWDQEKFCRDSMKVNAEYAQWGFQLRAEMFQKCGQKPTQSCSQKYRNLILRQGEKARASVDQAYAGVPDTNYAYRESVMRIDDQTLQALWAFTARPEETVKSVVKLAYETCIDTRMAEPDPIERTAPRSRRQPPPMPPVMPMPDLIGKSATQPGATIAPISGGCTNYTVMGQNGQAAYCQKCCYGDGNCQVTCN